jgi:hypothetical protein
LDEKNDAYNKKGNTQGKFMKAKRRFFSAMLAIFIWSGLLAGCGKKNDPINQAEKKDKGGRVRLSW